MSSAKSHSAVSFPEKRPRAVTKLPPEILTQIFHILLEKCRTWGNKEISWITVTHVCRFWRVAALHDPSLWSYLRSLPASWIDQYMQRSDPLPVDISYLEASSTTVKDRVCAAILESTHRIGKLHVNQCGGPDILSKLTKPAPSLTDLMLSCNAGDRIPPHFFGGHMPCLSSFIVSSVTIPLTAPWYCNIRELQLYGDFGFCDDNGPIPINATHILSLLHSLPKIESLEIEVMDRSSPMDTQMLKSFDGVLHLAHLTEAGLYFHGGCLPLVQIFNHISLAAPIQLNLCVSLEQINSDKIQMACHFFVKNIANTPSTLSWTDTAIMISSYNSGLHDDELTIYMEPSLAEDTLTVLIKHLIPDINIETLHLEASHPGWHRLCSSQTIEELKIDTPEGLRILLSTPGLVFPSLYHLHLREFDISEWIPELTLWLIGRIFVGAELGKLTLPSVGVIQEKDLASLRRYVMVGVEFGR